MSIFALGIPASSVMSWQTSNQFKSVVKTLKMIDSENCNFLSKGVAVRVRRSLMSRHKWKSCYNLHMHWPICTKIYMYDDSATLNMCIWQSWMNSIAPPSGHRNIILLLLYPFSTSLFIVSAWEAVRLKSEGCSFMMYNFVYARPTVPVLFIVKQEVDGFVARKWNKFIKNHMLVIRS